MMYKSQDDRTAPGEGRRPALAAAVLVLLLAAALVGPVAADTEIPMDASSTAAYSFGATYFTSASVPAQIQVTRQSEPADYYLAVWTPSTRGLDRVYLRGKTGLRTARPPFASDIYIEYNGQVLGTGTVDYFSIYDKGLYYPIIDLRLNEFTPPNTGGPIGAHIYKSDGSRLSTRDAYLVPEGDTASCPEPGMYAAPLFGSCYVSVTGEWHHNIRVVNNRYFYLDRLDYYSSITLTSGTDIIMKDTSYSDIFTPFPKYPLTYSVRDSFGQWWNGTIESESVSPSNPGDIFTLSLSPTTAPIGEPVTATLTAAADAPAYDEVAWVHGDEQRTFMHNTSGWWEFSYSTYEYDIPSTETAAHTYQFATESPPGLDPPQDQVRCLVYSGGRLVQELIGRVPLTENVAKTQLAVVVIDYSGGDTPILSGATVTVKDEISKQTIPAASVDSTFSRFNVERGRRYIVTAAAEGFVTGTRTVSADREIQTVEMYLTRDAAVVIPENSTLVQVDFLVKDTQNKHVEGALIALSDSQTSKTLTGLTNAYGTRTFLVERDHLQQYTISKDGYVGVRGTIDPTIPGTRVVVLSKESDWGPGTTPGSGTSDPNDPSPDHHKMVDQTLVNAEAIVPGLFSFALLMLFLSVMRRGGK